MLTTREREVVGMIMNSTKRVPAPMMRQFGQSQKDQLRPVAQQRFMPLRAPFNPNQLMPAAHMMTNMFTPAFNMGPPAMQPIITQVAPL